VRESATPPLSFPALGPVPPEVDFLGGRLTSDGGLAWIAEADAALGVTAALAAVIPDWRRRRGRHDLATLVAQRVDRIACGYEDQGDADALRTDPLLKHVCGRVPESGPDLASRPTLSRLENAIGPRTCYRLAAALGEVYLRERERDRGSRARGARPGRHRRPAPRRPGGQRPPRLLPAAPVLPAARLRRRHRPARRRRPPPGDGPRRARGGGDPEADRGRDPGAVAGRDAGGAGRQRVRRPGALRLLRRRRHRLHHRIGAEPAARRGGRRPPGRSPPPVGRPATAARCAGWAKRATRPPPGRVPVGW
jgi:Transposase DDE domain group 1